MIDEKAEALNRRDLHCMAAAFVTAIVGLAVWGLVSPWHVVWVNKLDLPGDLGFGIFDIDADLGSLFVGVGLMFLGGMVLGWYGWAILAQRRRPWPLRRRLRSERISSRWPLRVVPFLLPYLAARLLADPLRDWTGLSFRPFVDYWVRISAPIDLAIEVIVWLLAYTVVWLPVFLLVQAMLRQWYPDEAPIRIAEPPTVVGRTIDQSGAA